MLNQTDALQTDMHKQTPVVVFGHQPFASWVVDKLLTTRTYALVGVVTWKTDHDYSYHKLDFPPLWEYAQEKGLALLEEKNIESVIPNDSNALGITARHGKLIKPNVVRLFRKGILNCHGGYLPRWRGLNIPNHVVLEGASRGGATLHYIDEGVDTGPILDRIQFDVAPQATAYDVYLDTQAALMELVERNLERLAEGEGEAISQEELISSGEEVGHYKGRLLDMYRCLKPNTDIEEVERAARAFEFPGRERAYFETGGRRVYVTINSEGSATSSSLNQA